MNCPALPAMAPRPPIAVPASDAPEPRSSAPPTHPATGAAPKSSRAGAETVPAAMAPRKQPVTRPVAAPEESTDRCGQADVVLDAGDCGGQVDLLQTRERGGDRGCRGRRGIGGQGGVVSVDDGGDGVREAVCGNGQRHRVDQHTVGVADDEVVVLVAQGARRRVDDDLVTGLGDVPTDRSGERRSRIGVGSSHGGRHRCNDQCGRCRESSQLHVPQSFVVSITRCEQRKTMGGTSGSGEPKMNERGRSEQRCDASTHKGQNDF